MRERWKIPSVKIWWIATFELFTFQCLPHPQVRPHRFKTSWFSEVILKFSKPSRMNNMPSDTKSNRQIVLEIPEDLWQEGFIRFRWYLNQKILNDCPAIPKSWLENANRAKTACEMCRSYKKNVTKVTKIILELIRNIELAERLSRIASGSHMDRACSLSSSEQPPPTALK